jgi:hypothetical protein
MEESRKSGGAAVVFVILALIALPILYVLSLGPAVWLMEHNYLDRDLARHIYYPLIFVAESIPLVRSVMQWYMELFV